MKAASAQKGPLLSHDFSFSEILVTESYIVVTTGCEELVCVSKSVVVTNRFCDRNRNMS